MAPTQTGSLGTGNSFAGFIWLVSGARVALPDGQSHLVLTLINPNMHDDPGCGDGTGMWADYGSYSGLVTGGEGGVYTNNPSALNSCGQTFTRPSTIEVGTYMSVPIEPEGETAVAEAYRIEAAYPNPFSEETTLLLTVREGQHVRAGVYDALGRRVAVLHRGPVAANAEQALRLEGRGLAAGSYVVVFTGEAFTASRKVLLAK